MTSGFQHWSNPRQTAWCAAITCHSCARTATELTLGSSIGAWSPVIRRHTWLTAAFGVTRVSIPHGTVARLPVPAVDLDTQRTIAAYLDREAGEIDAMLAQLDALVNELQDRVRIVQTRAVFGLGRRLCTSEPGAELCPPASPSTGDVTSPGYASPRARSGTVRTRQGPPFYLRVQGRGAEHPDRGPTGVARCLEVPRRATRSARGEHDVAKPRRGRGVVAHRVHQPRLQGILDLGPVRATLRPSPLPKFAVHRLLRRHPTGVRPNAQRVTKDRAGRDPGPTSPSPPKPGSPTG